MSYGRMKEHLVTQISDIKKAGLYKPERVLTGQQHPHTGTEQRGEVLNLCANNYLGLANHPEVIGAARGALERWGYGMASVRFICGTNALHKELEGSLSGF